MNLKDAEEFVLKVMKGNHAKAELWWDTKNPNLGGNCPNEMIAKGREKTLFRWIENQKDGFHE